MESFDLALGVAISIVVVPLVQYLDTRTQLVGEVIRTEAWTLLFSVLVAWGLAAYLEVELTRADYLMKSLAATGFGKLALGGVKLANSKRKKG